MRAHELQREDTHANRDEQEGEEYRQMFPIDPQSEVGFLTQRRNGATNRFCFSLRRRAAA